MGVTSLTCPECEALVPAPILPPDAVLNPIPPRYCSACGFRLVPVDASAGQGDIPGVELVAAGSGDRLAATAAIQSSGRSSYIDEELRADERVLYHTRQHPARLARAVLLALLVGATFAFVSLASPLNHLIEAWLGPSTAPLAWGAALFLVGITIIFGLASSLLGLSASELVVTNQRILGRVGGIFQRRVDIPLNEIAGISASSRALSLLGHGSVAVFIPGR